MATPVIICDDSSFARKQIARALPEAWDTQITYATNGTEAIESIEAGKGDIIFLDLSIPGIDGFGVLEHIATHKLSILPIVISGDIQQDSQQRALQLGAIAFIQKPINTETLSHLLDQYDICKISAEISQKPDEKTDFFDWIQEVSNIAMGRAANLLSQAIGCNILISTPKASLLEPSELDMMLASATGNSDFQIATQGFIGAGISGETLLIYKKSNIPDIAQLLLYDDEINESAGFELLTDITNILVGASLKSFANQLGINFSHGHPIIYGSRNHSQNPVPTQLLLHHKILTLELNYDIGEQHIHCNQLILFTEKSIPKLHKHSDTTLET